MKSKSLKPFRAVLVSFLLIAFLTGCAHSRPAWVEPVRCDEPVLEGDTWADIAILALRRGEALRECNIRNGFPVIE